MVGKIALVGAGAVGSYYGLVLQKAGEDVNFLLRSNYQQVKQSGLTLVHHGKENKIEHFQNLNIYSESQQIGLCDWVIIATKTTVNHELTEILEPVVGENTAFLTLQNGMGNVENLRNSFGINHTVVGGLCFTCINRTSPTTVESLFPGYVQFGQLGQRLTELATSMVDSFNKAGVKVKCSDSLEEALWRKLCWNVPFNGLSIVGGGITTDLILNSPEFRIRAEKLMKEIQSAAKEYGVTIEDSFLDRQFSLTEPMGPYKPSSLIDYLAGKTVEIESIWGEPLKKGKEMGLLMPELERLYTELLKI
tara:strand:- start:75 stop:992 length:918 start_codon:yes stop_codon:yes gene_type:complete